MADDDWDAEPAPATPPRGNGTPGLWLLVDVSGSMTEGSKPYRIRNVARTVEQFVRFGHLDGTLRLAALRDGSVWVVGWNPDDEFPLAGLFPAAPPADAADLSGFLGNASGRMLLLSDGFLDRKTANALRAWAEGRPDGSFVFVPIGADTPAGAFRAATVDPEDLWTLAEPGRPR